MKVLFVEYCAKDILDGTQNMDAITELAYRRIIDMIYSTNDQLIDDDKVLKYSTKTGGKWKSIKQSLIEVHGKIYIENGCIKNKKCTEKLQKSVKNIEQKAMAGRASSQSRKPLKNKETTPTAVPTPELTAVPTNQEPNNQSKKKKIIKKKNEFEIFWEACPKKRGRKEAERKYWIAREEIEADNLLAAVKRHKRDMAKTEEQFIPMPATWLHQGRYYDELSIPESEPVEEWPKWKRAVASRIGEHNVKGWLAGVSYQDGKLMVPRRFQLDKIKNEFAIDIEHTLGQCEAVLMQ